MMQLTRFRNRGRNNLSASNHPLSPIHNSFIDSFSESIDQMINAFFSDFNLQGFKDNTRSRISYPKTDIRETEKEIIFHIAVPGVKPNDLKVHVEESKMDKEFNVLNPAIISVSFGSTGISENSSEEDASFIRKEISHRSFHREWTLPEYAELNTDISTKLENGILEIRIPKKPKQDKLEDKPKLREIPISSS